MLLIIGNCNIHEIFPNIIGHSYLVTLAPFYLLVWTLAIVVAQPWFGFTENWVQSQLHPYLELWASSLYLQFNCVGASQGT